MARFTQKSKSSGELMVIRQGGDQTGAEGSWRLALLRHRWGRGSRPRGELPWSPAMGGSPGGPDRDSQGWWCPQGHDNKSLPYYWLFILSGKVHTLASRWSLISQFIQKQSLYRMGEIHLTGLPVSQGSLGLPVMLVTLQWTEERRNSLRGHNSCDLGEAGAQTETSHPFRAS